jgi:hypothetical protein
MLCSYLLPLTITYWLGTASVSNAGKAWMPQVDVLLGILVIKPDVMCCLMQVGWVQHTRLSVGDVKAA